MKKMMSNKEKKARYAKTKNEIEFSIITIPSFYPRWLNGSNILQAKKNQENRVITCEIRKDVIVKPPKKGTTLLDIRNSSH